MDNGWLKKIFFVLLGLFIILTTITGIQYGKSQSTLPPDFSPKIVPTEATRLNPTIDPTADWKRFENESQKFSFKYPSNWTDSNDVGFFNNDTMKFIFDVKTEITALSTEDWTNKNICSKFATDSDQNGCTAYNSGSIENSIQFIFLANYGAIHTVFKNEDTIFDVSMAAREPNLNLEAIKNSYNQILSTFKFTDSLESCQYNGITYQSGDSFPSTERCNNCTCKNGKVDCTTGMACL